MDTPATNMDWAALLAGMEEENIPKGATKMEKRR